MNLGVTPKRVSDIWSFFNCASHDSSIVPRFLCWNSETMLFFLKNVQPDYFQVLSTHFQSWYVTFYYEPSSYGMLAENFPLYLSGGQSALFLAIHIAAILPPIVFYGWVFMFPSSKKNRNDLWKCFEIIYTFT